MSKKTSKKNIFISVALVCAICITAAFAFLTASETSINTFTVGNVDIELTEPVWDANVPSGTLENITAGQVIEKDPTVTNTGTNNAYVYFLVEVPKAQKAMIVVNDIPTSVNQCQLFDYSINNGWSLIAENSNNELDMYNYYLYAYNTALAPEQDSVLFNNVTFANVTSEYANSLSESDADLNIKVTAYAIQSDFYGNEADDPESAWQLYANQNGWEWPSNRNENLVVVNYKDQSGNELYSEIVDACVPTELHYSTDYAKTGYFFEWVNSKTKDTAYSGMKFYEDTTLTASYTETGYGDVPSGYGIYLLEQAEDGSVSFSLFGVDVSNASFPNNGNNPGTFIIPSSLSFRMPSVSDTSGETLYASMIDGVCVLFPGNINLETGTTLNIPVTRIADKASHTYLALDSSKTIASVDAYYENIIIPDSVETIGKNAFALADPDGYLVVIENVLMSYGVKSIEEGAFGNGSLIETVKLPTSLNKIGEMAFLGCESITSIEISDGVSVIEPGAFDSCKSLETVNIPENLTQINNDVFAGCYELKNIDIPNSVNQIGDRAFENCSALTTIHIPDSIVSIGENTFRGCDALTEFAVDETNDSYTADNGALFNKTKTVLIHYPAASSKTSYTIPETVKQIKSYAFYNSKIKEVTIPESTDIIENNAFRNCKSLSGVLIKSSNLKSIEESTFNGCTSVESIVIPQGVTSIGSSSFYGCTKLNTIRVPSSVKNIEYGAFNKCSSLERVFYTGTESQWNDIKVYGGNAILNEVTISGLYGQTFYACSNLKTTELPDALKQITAKEFYG